jgi:hypothetical protein
MIWRDCERTCARTAACSYGHRGQPPPVVHPRHLGIAAGVDLPQAVDAAITSPPAPADRMRAAQGPMTRQRGVDPMVHRREAGPMTRHRGEGPMTRQRGVDPMVHRREAGPMTRHRGVDPMTRQRGVDPMTRLGGTLANPTTTSPPAPAARWIRGRMVVASSLRPA